MTLEDFLPDVYCVSVHPARCVLRFSVRCSARWAPSDCLSTCELIFLMTALVRVFTKYSKMHVYVCMCVHVCMCVCVQYIHV